MNFIVLPLDYCYYYKYSLNHGYSYKPLIVITFCLITVINNIIQYSSISVIIKNGLVPKSSQ